MASPTIQAEGTAGGGTSGAFAVTIPAHVADDILILQLVAWAPNSVPSGGTLDNWPTPTGGWTPLGSQLTLGTEDGKIAWFWKRATASGHTATIGPGADWDSGTDCSFGGRAWVIRGCITSGDPWDQATATTVRTAANGTVSAVTVSGTERLVMHFLACSDDWGTDPTLTGWTAGTVGEITSGTDNGHRAFSKTNQSSNTTADTLTIPAPTQGGYAILGVSFRPPATGGSFSRTASDTVSIGTSEASRGAITFLRTSTDTSSIGASTAGRAAIAFARTVADTLSAISDSIVRLLTYPRSASDSVPVGTSEATRTGLFGRTPSESIPIGSSTATRAGLVLARALSETISIGSSTAAAAKTLIRTATDSILIGSSTAARGTMALARTVADTVGIGASTATRGTLGLVRATTDSVAIGASTVTRGAISLARTASDTISIGASVVTRSSFAITRTAISTATIGASTASRAAISFARTISDSIPVGVSSAFGQLAGGAVHLFREAVDIVTTSDSVSRVVQATRTLADTLSVSDGVSRAVAASRAIVDALTTSDAVTRSAILARGLVDTISGLTDSIMSFVAGMIEGVRGGSIREVRPPSASISSSSPGTGLSSSSEARATIRPLDSTGGSITEDE
jgi:hypothetical protein